MTVEGSIGRPKVGMARIISMEYEKRDYYCLPLSAEEHHCSSIDFKRLVKLLTS